VIPYIPNTEEDQKEMLKEIGAESIEALFSTIPQNLRLKTDLNLPSSLSEMELVNELKGLCGKNAPVSSRSIR